MARHQRNIPKVFIAADGEDTDAIDEQLTLDGWTAEPPPTSWHDYTPGMKHYVEFYRRQSRGPLGRYRRTQWTVLIELID